MKCSLLAVCLIAPAACAQSLFLQPSPAYIETDENPAAPIRGLSLTMVEPPPPRTYALHDLITIIVDETSRAEADQSLETKKDYKLNGSIEAFPSLAELAELRLVTGGRSPVVDWQADHKSDYKGDGQYERTDRLVVRITAEVIDVKPNGNLVVEAKKTVIKDTEEQTVVLSGTCRGEDVTADNTILSTQLADLNVAVRNEGQVKKASQKGLIPRALDTLFAF